MRKFRIDHDLFFLSKAFFHKHQSQLSNCLVLPMKEFLDHSSYSTVHSASNHSLWLIQCELVLVAAGGWYEQQSKAMQSALFQESTRNGSSFSDGQRPITIRHQESLSQEEIDALIRREDEAPCAPWPETLLGWEHLKARHGAFPSCHGANCFAAVLYAISGNEFILNEWVHPKTFRLFLENAGYQRVEGADFRAEDVLCFMDEGELAHACYAVSDTHCFNKNGQTFWEAWSIAGIDSIRKDFEGLTCQLFRGGRGLLTGSPATLHPHRG